ncbi:unnamed protein product [Ectocarpus sp. 12 AP-2014]
MSSALGRALSVGARGFPAAGAGRRVGEVAARGRGLKTNPHVEEWMGKREISEKTFTFTPKVSLGLFMAIVVFPVVVYGNIKAGMETKDAKEGRKREYF